MGAPKQKVKQSERDRARLAKNITDKGFKLNSTHVAASKADIGYKNNGINASKGSAKKAISMKRNIKASRGKGARGVTQNSITAAKADSAQFGITARSGVSNLQRQAQAARGAVGSAARTLDTVGRVARHDAAKEHDRWVGKNAQTQGLMDLASIGVAEGLGAYWDGQGGEKPEALSATDKAKNAQENEIAKNSTMGLLGRSILDINDPYTPKI